MLRRSVLVLSISFSLPWPGALRAQTQNGEAAAKPTIEAFRLMEADLIDLDGRIDEPFWRRITPATGFLQRDPDEGAPATEDTEVYVAYDENNFYLGVVLHDSDPSGILAYQKARDGFLFTDDSFAWILDTFQDGRTGYYFEVNPAGLMGDGLIGGGGGGGFGRGGGGGGGGGGGFGINKSWDGIWEARVARGDYGWSAEVRIPFSTLNFNPTQDTWGINFQRNVRRKNEDSRWTGHRRNQRFTRPVHAGQVTGLRGMSQGMGLEFIPYGLAGWNNVPTNLDPTETKVDAGLDMSYNITSSLRAALTINTDFAEVEVDQRRVNLTRFPLFFPERRDFFLEGSGVFSFSPTSGVTPYFSRNIGLAAGEPVPITYGARLGGQDGRYELGFVQVHTTDNLVVTSDADSTFVRPEDFTVARVKRTIGQQSSIGVIYTRRATAADATGIAPPVGHTFGADLDLFTSRFLGDKNLQFEAFFVGHTDRVDGGTSTFNELTARGVRINYPNDIWRISASYRELGDDFDPSLGFTRRNGFRRLQPTITFAPRGNGFLGIRQFEFEAEFEYLTNPDWVRETQKTDFKLLGLRFDAGDRFDFNITHLKERLDDAFEIFEGIEIPIGDYETVRARISLRTASRRVVSVGGSVNLGGFWSGDGVRYEISGTVRPAPGVNFVGRYEVNDVDLPEGAFITRLARVEANWQMSPWASFTSNVQYDDVSDIVGLFARFRWILRPGSDFFLVYSHNWQDQRVDLLSPHNFNTISRGASTKLNYTHRF
ncbi:MAG: carbohydrate binding family 9 domain-containing protein [Gemmatimonadetes bacterium]|nr:carbohydrate binding family 9 domain-containing protein [Gemmatimonadota bacterium]